MPCSKYHIYPEYPAHKCINFFFCADLFFLCISLVCTGTRLYIVSLPPLFSLFHIYRCLTGRKKERKMVILEYVVEFRIRLEFLFCYFLLYQLKHYNNRTRTIKLINFNDWASFIVHNQLAILVKICLVFLKQTKKNFTTHTIHIYESSVGCHWTSHRNKTESTTISFDDFWIWFFFFSFSFA